MVYFCGFFAELGHFAGFSLYIIYITGRISEVAMAWDILFFSLGGPVEGYTGAQTVVFAGSICYYAIRNSDTAMGRAGGGGAAFLRRVAVGRGSGNIVFKA